jgi:hypothetical protein
MTWAIRLKQNVGSRPEPPESYFPVLSRTIEATSVFREHCSWFGKARDIGTLLFL